MDKGSKVSGLTATVRILPEMSGDPRVSKSRQPKAYTPEQLDFLKRYASVLTIFVVVREQCTPLRSWAKRGMRKILRLLLSPYVVTDGLNLDLPLGISQGVSFDGHGRLFPLCAAMVLLLGTMTLTALEFRLT